jgi:DNA-binding CsgD family transcriptional regulator
MSPGTPRTGGRAGQDRFRPPADLTAARFESDALEVAVLEWSASAWLDLGRILTPAEVDVVRLALEGNSNQAVAGLRGRSVRTVANQLASAYAKLGVGSRAELAARVARRGTAT